MRKTIIALFALAAVGLVQPTAAFARGGGGGGGHGGGGGGGGGHGGGMGGGGFHGGGFHGGFAGGGFHSGGFHGRFHGGFHRVRLQGLALGPTTTDTIPTRTTTLRRWRLLHRPSPRDDTLRLASSSRPSLRINIFTGKTPASTRRVCLARNASADLVS